MAVLKLISQREDTYAQVMVAVRQVQEMQQKAEKRARKFRKQARLLSKRRKTAMTRKALRSTVGSNG